MRTYVLVSGAVFGVFALVHVARLFLGWPAQVAGWTVPMWVSWIAIIVAGTLGIWAIRLATGTGSKGS